MTSEQFTQWLKGFLEAIDGQPTEKQMATIKKKLDEVVAAPPALPITIPGYGPPPSVQSFGSAQITPRPTAMFA